MPEIQCRCVDKLLDNYSVYELHSPLLPSVWGEIIRYDTSISLMIIHADTYNWLVRIIVRRHNCGCGCSHNSHARTQTISPMICNSSKAHYPHIGLTQSFSDYASLTRRNPIVTLPDGELWDWTRTRCAKVESVLKSHFQFSPHVRPNSIIVESIVHICVHNVVLCRKKICIENRFSANAVCRQLVGSDGHVLHDIIRTYLHNITNNPRYTQHTHIAQSVHDTLRRLFSGCQAMVWLVL